MGDIPAAKATVRRPASGMYKHAVMAAICMAAAGATAQQAQVPTAGERDPKAIEALSAMGKYLRTLKAFSVHSEASRDEVLDSGQKFQIGSTVTISARLPDRLRVDVRSDLKERRYYYNGKTVTQFAPRLSYYATIDAPATVRETLAAAEQKYGLELPLSDLFFWGTDDAGIEDIRSAIDLGPSRIGDRDCRHYAFRQTGVDWQLWIAQGKQPLPCKLVITTTDELAQPQYSSVLRWDLKAGGDSKTYEFTPPKGAHKVVMAPVPVAK